MACVCVFIFWSNGCSERNGRSDISDGCSYKCFCLYACRPQHLRQQHPALFVVVRVSGKGSPALLFSRAFLAELWKFLNVYELKQLLSTRVCSSLNCDRLFLNALPRYKISLLKRAPGSIVDSSIAPLVLGPFYLFISFIYILYHVSCPVLSCLLRSRGAPAGALRMSGLPADFDPLSPSLDHLSMIDDASKSRSQPRVRFLSTVLERFYFFVPTRGLVRKAFAAFFVSTG